MRDDTDKLTEWKREGWDPKSRDSKWGRNRLLMILYLVGAFLVITVTTARIVLTQESTKETNVESKLTYEEFRDLIALRLVDFKVYLDDGAAGEYLTLDEWLEEFSSFVSTRGD